jgi:hypothetical protein
MLILELFWFQIEYWMLTLHSQVISNARDSIVGMWILELVDELIISGRWSFPEQLINVEWPIIFQEIINQMRDI